MSRNAKTEQVIRRVVLGREYQVYSMNFKEGKMDLIETVTADKRPSESELSEKHGIDKVVILATKVKTGYYGVSIEKFMEIAELVDTKEKVLSGDESQE